MSAERLSCLAPFTWKFSSVAVSWKIFGEFVSAEILPKKIVSWKHSWKNVSAEKLIMGSQHLVIYISAERLYQRCYNWNHWQYAFSWKICVYLILFQLKTSFVDQMVSAERLACPTCSFSWQMVPVSHKYSSWLAKCSTAEQCLVVVLSSSCYLIRCNLSFTYLRQGWSYVTVKCCRPDLCQVLNWAQGSLQPVVWHIRH